MKEKPSGEKQSQAAVFLAPFCWAISATLCTYCIETRISPCCIESKEKIKRKGKGRKGGKATDVINKYKAITSKAPFFLPFTFLLNSLLLTFCSFLFYIYYL